jgi:hypothetical protein
MFDKNFFKKHQRKLLWLLNAPIIRIWFRYVLRIRKYDCPTKVKITEITPNSFSYGDRYSNKNGEWYLERTTDFRGHNKYGKRLYYAFKALWYLFHAWDWVMGDRVLYPRLSFGFSTLTAYPAAGSVSPCDGYTDVQGNTVSWSNTRSLANGTYADNVAVSGPGGGNTVRAILTGGNWYLSRSIYMFDTSSLGSGATISAATLSLYGLGSVSNANSVSFSFVGCNPASTSSIAVGDYSAGITLNSPTEYNTRFAFSSWSTSAYNDISFNANGISAIAKTGISKFMTRSSLDIDNSAPTDFNIIDAYYADQTGTSQDPKLVITYSSSSANPNFFAFFN